MSAEGDLYLQYMTDRSIIFSAGIQFQKSFNLTAMK